MDLQVVERERNGAGSGLRGRNQHVQGLQAPLQGLSLGHLPSQELPLPLKLKRALPRREAARVANALPLAALGHEPPRQPRPALELAVVLPQPPS